VSISSNFVEFIRLFGFGFQ